MKLLLILISMLTVSCSNLKFIKQNDRSLLISTEKSYLDSHHAIITDLNTGLIWQKRDENKAYKWDGANDYCENLHIGGLKNWRLPNLRELLTLVDYTKFKPSIDEVYFPGTESNFYWSSTLKRDDTRYAWAVHFGAYRIDFKLKNNNIACVRCVSEPERFKDEFEYHLAKKDGSGITIDEQTGFVWQKRDDGGYKTWNDAKAFCEKLVLGGFDDWRLPNIFELFGLADHMASDPEFDIRRFPGSESFVYWSSTAHDEEPLLAWAVDMKQHEGVMPLKEGGALTRCVRTMQSK